MPGPNVHIPHGTQILLRRSVGNHVHGAAGIVLRGGPEWYRIGFPNGEEVDTTRNNLMILRLHQKDVFAPDSTFTRYEGRIAYLAVVGSHAYGLNTDISDLDQRGFYIPRTDDLLSLRGVPETVQGPGDLTIWELRHFIHLLLNANPNVIEAAFTPTVTHQTAEAEHLLASRQIFLSKRVYVTYQGYAMSQFKKLEQDLRSGGEIRWKHAMHLLRLLLSGAHLLLEGHPLIEVSQTWRETLLMVRRGELPWSLVDELRKGLQATFELAHAGSPLPDNPDYDRANTLLLEIRRSVYTREIDHSEDTETPIE